MLLGAIHISTNKKQDKIPNFGFLSDIFKVDRFVSRHNVKNSMRQLSYATTNAQ